jgi:hypothetical protein
MLTRVLLGATLFLASHLTTLAQATSLVMPPAGKANGKHIVFLSGDEEYRGEESLPMLAKILSQRHGFKCTVLFALDADGTINPDNQKSLPGSEALDSADAIVMALRFRQWPDEAMARFQKAWLAGKPIVALRTSTHAFAFPAGSKWSNYTWNSKGPWIGGWGKLVLGETWVTHWGKHKVEATRTVAEPAAKNDPLLRGVGEIFGPTDVYEVYPPSDAKVLLRGAVLATMERGSQLATHSKKRASDGAMQPVNEPMMPVAWTREVKNPSGATNRVFCTTMGDAIDLTDESMRRLVVNGVYWSLGMDIPAKADVRYVDGYEPSFYGFKAYRRGLKVADLALGKDLPKPPPLPAPEPKKKN